MGWFSNSRGQTRTKGGGVVKISGILVNVLAHILTKDSLGAAPTPLDNNISPKSISKC